MKSGLLLRALVLIPSLIFSLEKQSDAAPAAEGLWQATGGDNWANVKTIDFTVSVMQGEKTIAFAQHHLDVAASTDRVRWKNNDVTVNLAGPANDDVSKTAYSRWVSDSFWLLAPLTLKDRGVQVKDEGKKTIDGMECDVLHVTFDKAGLTPNDQCWLNLNPDTHLISSCDYVVEPGVTLHASWSDYQRSGGLTLATTHFVDNGMQIRISNLNVTTK